MNVITQWDVLQNESGYEICFPLSQTEFPTVYSPEFSIFIPISDFALISSSSSLLGLRNFRSKSRKYTTFSVLWLQQTQHSCFTPIASSG